jgi:hypothetical protein
MNTPKSATVTLRANGSILRLLALRRGEKAVTFALITNGDKKTERGMTTEHPNFDAAVVAIAKLADEATKRGWSRSIPGRAFVAKPDAFAAIPAAPKAAKGAK